MSGRRVGDGKGTVGVDGPWRNAVHGSEFGALSREAVELDQCALVKRVGQSGAVHADPVAGEQRDVSGHGSATLSAWLGRGAWLGGVCVVLAAAPAARSRCQSRDHEQDGDVPNFQQ